MLSFLLALCISTVPLIEPWGGSLDDPDSPARITQAEVVRLALESNPELRISREQLAVVRTLIKQAREFPPTSIDLDFDQQVTLLRSDETYYGISQEFEFPTRRGLRIKLAESEVQTAELEHEAIRRAMISAVKALYQRLALTQHLLAIGRESLEISKKLREMAEQKYEAGSVGKLEVLRARIEEATTANDLGDLLNEERALLASLNFFIGRSPDEPIEAETFRIGPTPTESQAELLEQALRGRFELRALESRQAAVNIEKALARSEYYPDFSVGFSRHRIAGECDSWDMVLGISVPLLGREAISGRVAEASAKERLISTEDEVLRKQIEKEVHQARSQLLRQAEKVRSFREEILALASDAFSLAERSYKEGEISNLELLESQRTLQEAKRGYAQAVFDYNLTAIDLEGAIGSDLTWPEENVATKMENNHGQSNRYRHRNRHRAAGGLRSLPAGGLLDVR